MTLQSGFQHPPMAGTDRTTPLNPGFIHISTRLLPRGEKFMLRITNAVGLIHEGHFKTC
ncbi:MAG: hypothetical protein MUF29_09490 [Chitinophagaceae bacterium]|nr:hypothetical protein [Chitinophagaceae bacterium]